MLVAKKIEKIAVHKRIASELFEGNTLGIYPAEWSKKMSEEIDVAQLNTFLEMFNTKLSKIEGATVKQNTITILVEKKTEVTKQLVLEKIYETINNYRYSEVQMDTEDAITYMIKHNVISEKDRQYLNEACTFEEVALYGIRNILDLYDLQDASSKGLLWKVEANGSTIYMLGSIHLADTDIYPFSNEIQEAYKASDKIGVELDLFDAEGTAYYVGSALYDKGDCLKDNISEDLYRRVVEEVAKIGLTEEVVNRYKPWYLLSLLTNLSYTDGSAMAATLGIDYYFTQKAINDNKEIIEFEGYEYQVDMLDSYSPELNELLLEDTLSESNQDTAKESIGQYLDTWSDGSLEEFVRVFRKEDSIQATQNEEEKKLLKEYYDKMFTVRDKEMTDKIDAYLKEGKGETMFIILGSGHYVGEDGIIAALEDKGYMVTQIK